MERDRENRKNSDMIKRENYEQQIRMLKMQLEESRKEIQRLNDCNEWMHDTIWELMRKLKKLSVIEEVEMDKKV